MQLNGVVIKCSDSASSLPTLVMLHGWGRSLDDLLPLGQLLANYCDIQLIDLPGFGKSPAPPVEGWDTSDYAKALLDYLKSHKLERVVLLGHSFGGRVALRIAAEHPKLVTGLILIGSHGIKPIRNPYQNLRVWFIKSLAKLVKQIDRFFGSKLFETRFSKRFGSADYQRAGNLKNTFVKTISEDQSQSIATIRVPALLLFGELDRETPPALGQRLHELLDGSKLIILAGKDHYPFFGTGGHLCANYIVEFLGKLKK